MSKEFKCRYKCGTTVMWAEEFKKGDGPINLDGSKHNCRTSEPEETVPTTNGLVIALVSFNIQEENSRGYYKTKSIAKAAHMFIKMLKDDKTDFISIRKVKK